MTTDHPNALLRRWRRWSSKPGGKWAFGVALGRMARYTGSIRARILEMDAGRARVEMRDRAAIRNHLRSIHAVALVNLGEVATGLAMISGIPDEARGIVTSLRIDYVKKARGTIVAVSVVTPPDWRVPAEHESVAVLTDAEGDVVARVTARWKIGPKAP
jgi:acyl-coenzyme A thioesterase PaaI-like protein